MAFRRLGDVDAALDDGKEIIVDGREGK